MSPIYRGETIEALPRPMTRYQKPAAINWRYRVSGDRHKVETSDPLIYQPR